MLTGTLGGTQIQSYDHILHNGPFTVTALIKKYLCIVLKVEI